MLTTVDNTLNLDCMSNSRSFAALRMTIAALCILVSACGGDKAAAPVTLAGNWLFADQTSNGQLGVTCKANASLTITQTGDTFTASLSGGAQACTGVGGTNLVAVTGVVFEGGHITGSSLTFSSGTCVFSGTISASSNELAGDETCTISTTGGSFTFDGHWQAAR